MRFSVRTKFYMYITLLSTATNQCSVEQKRYQRINSWSFESITKYISNIRIGTAQKNWNIADASGWDTGKQARYNRRVQLMLDIQYDINSLQNHM